MHACECVNARGRTGETTIEFPDVAKPSPPPNAIRMSSSVERRDYGVIAGTAERYKRYAFLSRDLSRDCAPGKVGLENRVRSTRGAGQVVGIELTGSSAEYSPNRASAKVQLLPD